MTWRPACGRSCAPLTTALMVATRSDPTVEAVPEEASDEERAVAFAKALARRAVLAWDGIGDADGNVIEPSPEAIDALLDVWPIFEAFQLTYVSKGLLLEQEKKRLRALAEWSFGGGERYCQACPPYEGREQACPDCPGAAETVRKLQRVGRSGTSSADSADSCAFCPAQ